MTVWLLFLRYESESECEICSVGSDSLQSHGLYAVHGILQDRILEWVAIPSPAELPDPGIKLGSPALQVISLPTEYKGSLL